MAAESADRLPPYAANSVERVAEFVRQSARSAWVDLLRADQSGRWRASTGVAVERYFELLPELCHDAEDSLVLICGEARSRCELGEHVLLVDYTSRFPDLAEQLAIQFELDRALGNLSGDVDELHESKSPELKLPGFELLRMLGEGASSRVYLARQISVDRLVAVKVIHAWNTDEMLRKRHRQEASILSKIPHPHIVQIYDTIEVDTTLYSIIEFVDGPTLAEFASGQPQTPCGAATLVCLLAQAIHEVHEAGVLHRDLKPSNVLLTSRGVPKITDFGLAKLISSSSILTTDQCLMGTPSYMPPEQAAGAGQAATREGDVYSLGAILYELLTGRPPYLGVTILDTLNLIRERDPTAPRALQPHIPRDLETICLKCLTRAPQSRYCTAAELADDLNRFLTGAQILARRATMSERAALWCRRNPSLAALTAGLVVTGLVGFLGVVWQWRKAEQARASEIVARLEADLWAKNTIESLERLKSANSLLEQGHRDLLVRRWDDALAAFTRAIELRPEHVQAWEARGEFLYIRLGLWDLASKDLARAYQLQPPKFAHRWWWNALLRLHQGDKAGYQEICARLRERQVQSGAADEAYFLVRMICLSAESSPPGLDIIGLSDELARCNSNQSANSHLQALARLRTGRPQQAIERCRASLAQDSNGFCRELNYPILALAYHQLGQTSDAREALGQAEDAMRQWTSERCQPGPDQWVASLGAAGIWPISCWDWLECEVFLREARQALGLDPTEEDPRLKLLRARSFAGLRCSEAADEEYKAAQELLNNDLEIRMEAHRNHAYCLIKQKDYSRAAEEFAQAGALSPGDSRLLEFQALMHLAAGEVDTYRKNCADMVGRFGQTQDPAVAGSVVDTCVLRPDALPDMTSLVNVGQVAVGSYFGSVRLLGAAHYRAGQYREAVDCFKQASRFSPLKPWDMAFCAMAHHRLGNTDEARRMLSAAAYGNEAANYGKIGDVAPENPNGNGWYESIQVPIVFGEAESMIEPHKARSTTHE